MSKKTKIIIVAIIVVIVIAIIVYISMKSGGTQFVSAAAMKKLKSGTYGTYSDSVGTDQYNAFYAAASALDSSQYSAGVNKGEAFARGWLKGVNIAMNKDNVATFQSDISAYIANSAAKPHWEVTAGSLLK